MSENEETTTLTEISTGADPPSFRINLTLRRKREDKIKRAKERIALTACEGRKSGDDKTLDEEDLLIEKLLLQGVEEYKLTDGYYESHLQELVPPLGISSDSVELTENDIPESELCKFIKSPEEVNMLGPVFDTLALPLKESVPEKVAPQSNLNAEALERADQFPPLPFVIEESTCDASLPRKKRKRSSEENGMTGGKED